MFENESHVAWPNQISEASGASFINIEHRNPSAVMFAGSGSDDVIMQRTSAKINKPKTLAGCRLELIQRRRGRGRGDRVVPDLLTGP